MREVKQISVILLCYRVFDYLFETIDSALRQDYDNIELVVSDDGSACFPVEEIRAYIETNRRENLRSVLVRHELKNMGTVRHFNNAIAASHGDFLCVLAGDDRLYDPHVLTRYVEGFDRAPEGCLVEMAQIAMCDSTLEHLETYYVAPEVQRALETGDSQELLDRLAVVSCLPSGSTALRREFVEQYGKFDESYALVEDYPLHLRLVREGWCIHYENFIAIAHRDGGISHGNLRGASHSQTLYSQDIIRAYQTELLPHLDRVSPQYHTLVQRKCRAKTAEYDAVIACSTPGFRGKWKRFRQHPIVTATTFFLDFYKKNNRSFTKTCSFLLAFAMLLLFLAPIFAEGLWQTSIHLGLGWMPGQQTWLRGFQIVGSVGLITAAAAFLLRFISVVVYQVWKFPNLTR